MPDIADFLLVRIAEVEADARNAIESDLDQWSASGFEIRFVSPGSLRGDGLGAPVAYGVTSKPVAHIARHDPAHVLAWCAALRAVVELHRHEAKGPGPVLYDGSRDLNEGVFGCVICSCVDDDPGWHLTGGWCDTVRQLAAIWADHPDFDPSWHV